LLLSNVGERLVVGIRGRNGNERLIVVDHGSRLIRVLGRGSSRFVKPSETEVDFLPVGRPRVQRSNGPHFLVGVSHWDFVSIRVQASVTDRRDSRTGRISFQKTSSLVSKISDECTFLFVGIPTEWILSIGNPSRSSSSTKEATIVVVGLGRERKVFGHLAFFDQPQSPSDKVDQDWKTDD
jgi:hypothetical protein